MSRPAMYRQGWASLVRNRWIGAGLVIPVKNADLAPPSPSSTDLELQETSPAAQHPAVSRPQKSFQIHIGAELSLPTANRAIQSGSLLPVSAQAAQPRSRAQDYFEGLPLKAWAERLGERVMPTVQLVQQENKRVKAAAAKQASLPQLAMPTVPHFLPFTRWAAESRAMKATLVAENSKQKPRLSWYHPDDTMVPRDWFKGGLLADLKYYRPFANSS